MSTSYNLGDIVSIFNNWSQTVNISVNYGSGTGANKFAVDNWIQSNDNVERIKFKTNSCNEYSSGDSYHYWYTDDNNDNTSSDKKMQLYQGDLSLRGNITAYGFSDIRLKDIVEYIENPIDKIKNIETFWYKPNNLAKHYGFDSSKKELGLSAQSVQNVMPDLADIAFFDKDDSDPNKSKSGENYLTVNYIRLIPLLVESIKKQQEIIENLKSRVESIESS